MRKMWLISPALALFFCAALSARDGAPSDSVSMRALPDSVAVPEMLQAAIVRPDDGRMRRLLQRIDSCAAATDPDRIAEYQCNVYTRLEMDAVGVGDSVRPSMRQDLGFLASYIDKEMIPGSNVLPLLVSETTSKLYHRSSPLADREVIVGSQNSVAQTSMSDDVARLSGGLGSRLNFHRRQVGVFGVDVPSPLRLSGRLLYRYSLRDSIVRDGRKAYVIAFSPKASGPLFDGEMTIDASDCSLMSIAAEIGPSGGINWVRSLKYEAEYARLGDSGMLFFVRDRIDADFSPMRQAAAVSILGTRASWYSEMSAGAFPRELMQSDNVTLLPNASTKRPGYWDNVSPVPFGRRESGIYEMTDQLIQSPAYGGLRYLCSSLVSGYFDTRYVGIGPYSNLCSYNSLEGVRFQLGARTTKELSRVARLTGYAAYGLKDKGFKGGGSLELMLGHAPTRKLTLSASHDVYQLGRAMSSTFGEDGLLDMGIASSMGEGSIFTSVFSRPESRKLSMSNHFSLCYEHEWIRSLSSRLLLDSRRIFPSRFVPMELPSGEGSLPFVEANVAGLSLRFAPCESVTRGTFTKTRTGALRYPVLSLDVIGTHKAMGRNSCSFIRPELNLDWRIHTAPVGYGQLHLSAGKIFGQVPYPFLKLHEGNPSFLLDRSAFACLDHFEFASDTWATVFYEHNFGGAVFGLIPGIKKLNLREMLTIKAAYGTLSARNDGSASARLCAADGQPGSAQAGGHSSDVALLCFPEGMRPMGTPYVEIGAGIANIFRIFRVDAFWRLTHRHENVAGPDGVVERVKSNRCFALNLGVDVRF